ncbi:unnamed protein product [Caenorhabditis brenneri]
MADRPACTPSTPRTYLLAYSTDINDTNFRYFFYLSEDLSRTSLWNTYAYVRLDMKNADDIHYFKNFNAFNQSLYSNYPDPSLGYKDNTTGSDMFDVIKKFLKNTENLCGSTIAIAAKRYPNEVEVDDLITELQKNHVFVYILSSDTPSGGSNPSAMFNVATRTNGYCVFSADGYLKDMYEDVESVLAHPNQIVANKFAVSGMGRQTVPFKPLIIQGCYNFIELEIVYQDHKVDGSLISLNYTITDEFGIVYPSYGSIPMYYTGYYDFFSLENYVQYYLNIDYEYEEGRQEVMVVRMYSEDYIPDYWLPFNN